MRPLVIRNLPIGEGMPKICAPLMGKSIFELEEEAQTLLTLPADIAEWRADQFEPVFTEDGTLNDVEASFRLIGDGAAHLRSSLGDMPILFTLRTVPEGGRARLTAGDYERFITLAASSGYFDLVDVELYTVGGRFAEVVKALHCLNVKVIGSSHDFDATPSREEILSRLCRMRDGGADICKTAVMPKDIKDVITLLSASVQMREEYPDMPLIALSMGGLGTLSRISGEYFGSDITFASAEKASAPGQLSVGDCRYIMDLIHRE